MQTTAIILAGGKSKRMGTDKSLLEINGVSLLEKAIKTSEQLCDTIIISSNNQEHQRFGYPLVADEIINCGPIGGIYSCLKKTKTQWNLVLSVDSPFVETNFLEFLMNGCGEFDAVVPFHDKGKEPLIAFYNRKCLDKIEQRMQGGNYKMHELLEHFDSKLVNAQSWLNTQPNLFRNLNRPEDLKR